MQNDPAPPGPAPKFEDLEQTGVVEMDRYCEGCGYNLRQQAVRRDPTTRLLLCRCPECGAYEPANALTTAHRAWFRMLVVVIWLGWFAIWLNLIGWSVGGVTGLAVVSGEIRTQWVDLQEVDLNQLAANDRLQNHNYIAGSPGSPGFYTNSVWDLRPMRDEDALIAAIFLALAGAIGAVMTAITVVAMPHWPRWGYVLFACGWPLIGIFIFHGLIWRELYAWRLVTVDLMRWHLVCAVAIEAVALVAGLGAVWLGRPVARLLVRLIVPPKRRGLFAFLWLVDGKGVPKVQGS